MVGVMVLADHVPTTIVVGIILVLAAEGLLGWLRR
jgi:hypothetical protein